MRTFYQRGRVHHVQIAARVDCAAEQAPPRGVLEHLPQLARRREAEQSAAGAHVR
jgi:hypothetical protein